MNDAPYILRMAPLQMEKVWGGDKLRARFGKPGLGGRPCGESWEVADLPEGQSLVAQGPLQGMTLAQASALWGAQLWGDATTSSPLLVKLLDAQQDLSIQVHPGESDLRADARLSAAHPKDECWIILDVEPQGAILHGLRDEGVDQRALRELIKTGQIAQALRRVEVEPGQVIRVPPGTLHAICQGVVLLEIQQPSDTTYRVYDYDRPGVDGKPRALHLEEALAVTRFGAQPPLRERPETIAQHPGLLHQRLISCSAYTIERLTFEGTTTRHEPWDKDRARVIFSLEGAVTLSAPQTEPVVLERAQTAIVPASLRELTLSPHAGSASVIIAWA